MWHLYTLQVTCLWELIAAVQLVIYDQGDYQILLSNLGSSLIDPKAPTASGNLLINYLVEKVRFHYERIG